MTAKKEGFVPVDNSKSYRKAQVSIFIILGIVLVAGVILFFILRSETEDIPLEPTVEEIPSEIEPVRTFTQECIDSVAKEGLEILGEQGGFIDTSSFTVNNIDPTGEGANALLFAPEGDMKVPYWRYMLSENSCDMKDSWCLFSSNKPLPGLEANTRGDNSIESQLSRYIDQNLPECLDSYQSFGNQFNVIPQSPSQTTVRVTEDGIVIYTDYKIKIRKDGVEHDISKFYVSQPLDLKNIYELAEEIAEAQNNYTFLERHTLNMITAFASVDQDKLPPKTELVFEPTAYTTWSAPQVKGKLEDMLMIYTPALQVYGTNNYDRQIFTDDVQQALYDQMVLPMNLDGKYRDYNVQFLYLGWWPPYMKINKGSNTISPDSAFNPLLPMFGFQRYSNTYDISYPVVVRITEPDAFYGEGYTFMFALESNIRNNKPMVTGEDFRNQEGYTALENSLFCNENQRTSASNKITLTDKKSDRPLADANVLYSCGEEDCYLGKTDEDGNIETSLPICANGIVSAYNQDYFIPARQLSTSLDNSKTLRMDAWPYIEKEVKVKKLPYIEDSDTASFAKDLSEKESAVIRMEKIAELPGEEAINLVASIDDESPKSNLRLVPGTYSLNIDVFLDEKVIVDDEVCYNKGLFGIGGEECDPFHVEFNESFPSAGARLNQDTVPVKIDASDLYSDKDIVLYVISPELPRTMEDLETMGQFTDLSLRFRQELEPRFQTIS